MEKILKNVLRRIKPKRAERERLKRTVAKLIELTNEACEKLKVRGNAMLVGSAARNTWLSSERDIDIFILLSEKLSREEFEQQGLGVARAVAGAKGKERYAEHPYITMEFDGFDVDLVPCYDIAKPSEIKSAVDRSPHHQRYIAERLTEKLVDEVLLTKQFMSGIGVYGSELKVQGFSGYLCELLLLNYGSFQKLLENASKWKQGEVIDIERSYQDIREAERMFEGQPLVVIDPVDANRNAAAAVSMQNFAIFIRACQDFTRHPSEKFFFPKRVKKLSARELREILKRRNTALFCIIFESPDVVADVLYPQLRKTEKTLLANLTQAGFNVLRSDVWAEEKAAILLELTAGELSNVQTRVGPPIQVDANDFIEKHLTSKEKLAGPMIDAVGRLVFELEREQAHAKAVIEQSLSERVAFGKHVAEALEKGYEVYEGKRLQKLCLDRKLATFISGYLTLCLPWYR